MYCRCFEKGRLCFLSLEKIKGRHIFGADFAREIIQRVTTIFIDEW